MSAIANSTSATVRAHVTLALLNALAEVRTHADPRDHAVALTEGPRLVCRSLTEAINDPEFRRQMRVVLGDEHWPCDAA